MLIYCLFRPPALRRSRPGYLSDTHSFAYNIQFNKNSWMASLSPSPARFYHLQMESLSPFPESYSDECKFMGTLVSNPLLPSSRERQTCQSNSSGSRKLNRGNYCTPKFSLTFFHKKSQLQAFPDFFPDWLKYRSDRLFSSVR